MVPVPTSEGRTLWIVGAARAAAGHPTRSGLIEKLRALGKAGPELVAVFDARSIASERHLLSAWAHLGRSRARGEERLRDRSAELALFVAGDDQLPRALQKVGFQSDSEAFVVVGERPRVPSEVLASLGLREEPSAYPRALTAETLDRLGITADDRQVVPESAWEGLVLERVAMLELTAGHSAGRPAAQTS
ncbi:MAG TPA: KEOPS complex subunit Cgi121 [Thermoplasmata archaeon]|jgi:tRNA threonylcarbamoyladenosine modification (KEOPS) complex Cgi121 subunit|nr:KEOPS complex subunit Cgi121 [Thermoplasmata archaeon]